MSAHNYELPPEYLGRSVWIEQLRDSEKNNEDFRISIGEPCVICIDRVVVEKIVEYMRRSEEGEASAKDREKIIAQFKRELEESSNGASRSPKKRRPVRSRSRK